MANNTITTTGTGKQALAITRAHYDSRERITLIICITVIISLICVALTIVLCRVDHSGKDYPALLLQIVSGSIFGLLGFRAGSKSASKEG